MGHLACMKTLLTLPVRTLNMILIFPVGKVKCGFHSCCGRNIRLVNNKMTASRSAGFNHGLVFSSKPLEEDEIFEVMDTIRSLSSSLDDKLLILLMVSCYDSFSSVRWEH